MGRRYSRHAVAPDQPEHRVNRMIRFPHIRVIAPDGEQLGVMSPDEGRDKAAELGLDLVEVAPSARPPVCRIMDYGRFKYEQAKKRKAQASSTPDTKTIQLRPKTDDHDLELKLGKAADFLDDGHRVRLVMRMRGREQAYPGRWTARLREHFHTLAEHGRIASAPSHQGRTISMLVEPEEHAS